MKIYGLIGNPLGHSFSKKYFTEKFSREHLPDCQYENFEIKQLQEEIPELKRNPLLAGLNITIPYKTDILPFLDFIQEECERVNACNCIKISQGKWTGFNTDITGFEKTFRTHLQPHHKKALVLGTGGSSKAVAYVLQKLGIAFLYVTRKKIPSAEMVTYDSVTPDMMEEFTIVVNTTPVGMFPAVTGFPPLPYESVSEKHYFFDLIYNPSKTLFLTKAEARGAIIKNGADMLGVQAEESWKIWNR